RNACHCRCRWVLKARRSSEAIDNSGRPDSSRIRFLSSTWAFAAAMSNRCIGAGDVDRCAANVKRPWRSFNTPPARATTLGAGSGVGLNPCHVVVAQYDSKPDEGFLGMEVNNQVEMENRLSELSG